MTHGRGRFNVERVLKMDKIEHKTPDALWCKRCQRGMTGLYEENKQPEGLKAGDDCPLCKELAIDGIIGHDSIGILRTCQETTDNWLELTKMKHREAELRKVRSIKPSGDVALEKTQAQDKEIADLKKQIDELLKLQTPIKVDAVSKEVSKEEPVGKATVSNKTGSK